jgi:methylated-DNA-[protein]-cysteine S-methyltransferase
MRDTDGAMTETTLASLTWLVVPSDLGEIALVAAAEALVGIRLPTRTPLATAIRRDWPGLEARRGTSSILTFFAHELRLYLAGGQPGFSGPLALPRATEYERAVYAATRTIPHGETRTYGWVAARAGGSPQSAGNALGRNPLPIIIPCHRVVAANGLGGFTGGLDLKRKLLELEGASPLNQVELPFAAPSARRGRARSAPR